MTKITFIGCGHMGGALVKGWITLPASSYQIQVIKPTPDFHDADVKNAISWSADYADIWMDSVVMLGVKPAMMRKVLEELKPYLSKDQSVITMAAGLAITQYKEVISNKVTRVMPSLPAAVHQSLTAVYGDEPQLAKTLFDPLGGTVVVDSDQALDTVTVIIGCAPGTTAYYLQSVKEAALELGLSSADAHRFVQAAAEASVNWLSDKPDYMNAISQVGREGSLTLAAVHAMRDAHLPQTMKAALDAALSKSNAIKENF